MKSKIYIFSVLVIIIILFLRCCRNAGTFLVKEDELKHADAIVILMGSMSDRILQSVDLYQLGLTDRIIIVEESMGVTRDMKARGVQIISNSSQVHTALIAMGIPDESIMILPGDAKSTQMEAMIIREYVKNDSGIDTLLMVSSASHTRRASTIFKSAFRKAGIQVHINSSPSIYSDFNARKWWRSKEDIQKVLMEYLKIVNFLLFEKRKL